MALAFGKHKPTDMDLSVDIIRDLNTIQQNGLESQGRIIHVNSICIVCDAPSRAMVKCVKQYSE